MIAWFRKRNWLRETKHQELERRIAALEAASEDWRTLYNDFYHHSHREMDGLAKWHQ